jgi:HTH-type transcriptional regulator/antitoxin HipB
MQQVATVSSFPNHLRDAAGRFLDYLDIGNDIFRMVIWHGEKAMSDVKRYIKNRSERYPEFAENYAVGYADFKIGVILRQAREAAGLTQEEVAQKLQTKKSAISRIENHAGDVRLSTIQRYAEAVGAKLQIRLASS